MERAHDPGTVAGRSLARCRWGSQRVDKLVAELAERRDDLTAAHLQALGVEVASRGAQPLDTPSGREDQ